MEVLENSVVGRFLLSIWYVVYRWYEGSGLCRLLRGVSRVWTGWFHGSALMGLLVRDGMFPKAWRDSFFCGLAETLINLPAAILHWIYRKGKPLFDHSFFAQLGFAMGNQTPSAIGWLMLGIMLYPYEGWDNRYSLMGFVLMALLLVVGGMGNRGLRVDLKSVGPYPLIFAGAVCLAWPVSYSSTLSMRFLFFHLTAMLCVGVTVSAVEHADDLKRLAGFASLALFGTSAYGVVQRIQGVEVNYSYVDPLLNEGMPGRVFSVFENPNAFAEVLVMLLPLSAALVLCSRSWWGRLGALCAAGVGVAALGMTYSRASWVGGACAMVVLVFLWKPKLLPAFAVLCVVAIPFLPDTIWNRILTIFSPADTSTASRIPLYQAALEVIRTSPVSGAGLGTAAVQDYIRDFNLYHAEAPFVHAHNFYLQVWIEAGLLGFLGFVGSMLWNIKKAAHTVRHCAPSAARTITCAGAAALCGAMVCGLADYLWNYPRVMCIFWFVFALTIAGIKVCRRETEAA